MLRPREQATNPDEMLPGFAQNHDDLGRAGTLVAENTTHICTLLREHLPKYDPEVVRRPCGEDAETKLLFDSYGSSSCALESWVLKSQAPKSQVPRSTSAAIFDALATSPRSPDARTLRKDVGCWLVGGEGLPLGYPLVE